MQPRLPNAEDANKLRWVPLSKLRIPQIQARAEFSPPPNGDPNVALPTIVSNIKTKADPRGISCLTVCHEEQSTDAGKVDVYWTEGTRRPIAWLLGGLPDELLEHDLVPVKELNCSGHGLDADASKAITMKIPKIKRESGDEIWKRQTPIVMYAMPTPDGSSTTEHAAYRELREEYERRVAAAGSPTSMPLQLRFAEDEFPAECPGGLCGADVLETCQPDCAERIKRRALSITNQFRPVKYNVTGRG